MKVILLLFSAVPRSVFLYEFGSNAYIAPTAPRN